MDRGWVTSHLSDAVVVGGFMVFTAWLSVVATLVSGFVYALWISAQLEECRVGDDGSVGGHGTSRAESRYMDSDVAVDIVPSSGVPFSPRRLHAHHWNRDEAPEVYPAPPVMRHWDTRPSLAEPQAFPDSLAVPGEMPSLEALGHAAVPFSALLSPDLARAIGATSVSDSDGEDNEGAHMAEQPGFVPASEEPGEAGRLNRPGGGTRNNLRRTLSRFASRRALM